KVLVDLILIGICRWIEPTHIKKCSVGKRWLPPTAKIITAVQKLIESRERVERNHRDGEPAIESERGGPDVGLEIESRRPRSRAATARCDPSNLTEKTIARTRRCIGEETSHSVRDRGIAGLSCSD